MDKLTSTTDYSVVPLSAARLSLASAVTVLVLLAGLHLISPEFDPSWRMVSEYALGEYAWVLSLMFLAWAFSCAALFFAVRPHIQTVGGKIGLGFLLASAVGMGMAAIFDVRHSLHGLAAIIGMPTLPVAALLISTSLARNPSWVSTRTALLWMANLPWISFVVFAVTMIIGLSQSGGAFGPGTWIGLTNRIWLTAYCAWLIVAARSAERVRSMRVS